MDFKTLAHNVVLKEKERKKKTMRSAYWAILIIITIMLIVYTVWIMWYPESFGLIRHEDVLEGENNGNTFGNCVYFWSTTTSTIGYGDICPKTSWARGVTSVYQIFMAWVSFGFLFHISEHGIHGFKEDIKTLSPIISRSEPSYSSRIAALN